MTHDWYVVTSQGRVILGVFGSALLSDAQACAARVERATGMHAFVSRVSGTRPRVGAVLTSTYEHCFAQADKEGSEK